MPFKPPSLDSYEGPAQGFTPPSLNSYEGPAQQPGPWANGYVGAQAQPQQPGFWATVGHDINPLRTIPAIAGGLVNTVLHPIASSEVGQAADGAAAISPADAAKALADLKARQAGTDPKAGMRGLGEQDVPPAGQTYGHLAGAGINAGLLAAATAAIPPVFNRIKGLLQSSAVPVADSAIGVKAIQRGYGKTPGAAALAETSGILPDTVSASARERINLLDQELERKAAASTIPANFADSKQVLDDRIAAAKAGNSAYAPAEVEKMKESLVKPRDGFAGATVYPQGAFTPIQPMGQQMPGVPLKALKTGPAPEPVIADLQSASDALRIKREFGKDYTRWNPLHPAGEMPVGREAYHQQDLALDKAVPEGAAINQRISSLIPVEQNAEAQALNASVTQRAMHRIAAHSGALLGAFGGYHAGGIPGAVAGLVIPEVLSSPTTRMAAARAIYGTGGLLGTTAAQRAAQAALLSEAARKGLLFQ